MRRNLICGMDIGTTHVRVIVGELIRTVRSVLSVSGQALKRSKKGVIVDLDKTVEQLQTQWKKERMVGSAIPSTF